MKSIALTVLSALSMTAAALSYAENATFVGPAIGVNGTVSYMKTKTSDGVGTLTKTTIVPGVMASYGFEVSKDVILTARANYTFLDTKAGSLTFPDKTSLAGGLPKGGSLSGNFKHPWSVGGAIGWRVDPAMMVYGMMNYHSMNGQFDFKNQDGNEIKGFSSLKGRWNGLGTGVGLAWAQDRLELSAEYEYVIYGGQTFKVGKTPVDFTIQPRAHIGRLAVNYRF